MLIRTAGGGGGTGDGDVVGPASSTDNAVARWDGNTGKLLQDSGVLVDDSNNVTGVVNLTGSGVPSFPGAGASSERFGANSLAAGSDAVAVGNGASAAGSSGSIAVGRSASAASQSTIAIGSGSNASTANSIAIGYQAAATGALTPFAMGYQSVASQLFSVAIGAAAQATGINGFALGSSAQATGLSSLAVGTSALAQSNYSISLGATVSASFASCWAVGVGATATASYQWIVGGTSGLDIRDCYFGKGVTNTTPQSITFQPTGESGSNQTNTANFIIAGSKGTGTGAGGDVIFATADVGASGSTLNTISNRVWVKTTTGFVGLGTSSPATILELAQTSTITGAVTDSYVAGLTSDPAISAASSQTVTRLNYWDVQNVALTNVTVTDGCVMRFDAAAGTHCAVDAGTTKTTPGTVDAWVKVNVNGTVYYLPAYTSKTT